MESVVAGHIHVPMYLHGVWILSLFLLLACMKLRTVVPTLETMVIEQ